MSIQRNTVYNLIGSIIPLVVTLVTVPMYLNLIGEARFGVLAIVWLLLGYFGLFDLGLGRATAQRIAALRSASNKERASVFWTALILNVIFGVIGGLLIWPAAVFFFGSIFKVEETLRPEIQLAIPWLILAVPIATLSGVLVGALQGRERFLVINLISVSGTILFQIFPLFVAVFISIDLNFLIPAALFARIVTIALLFISCHRYVFLNYAPSFLMKHAGKLARFGGWVTITAFVGPVMVILDRFIIGAISGAKTVSFYTVPFQLGERSTIFSGSLVSALFPRFATAATTTEEYRLAIKGQRLLVSVMTPIASIGIIFIEPFLAWWISQEFANQSALLGQVLILGFWFNSFAKIPSVQLQARGRPDLVAKCHLAEVLPYLGLLYLAVSLFGSIGAAIIFSLRTAIDFILLAWYSGILSYSLRLMILPMAMLFFAFIITIDASQNQIYWTILVSIYLFFTMLLAWVQLPTSLRDKLAELLKKILFSYRGDSLK